MAKVVIIDDEVSILELMAKCCRALGHEVTSCETGASGIAAMRQIRPEVMIVDLLIPDANGLDIIKLCRAELPNTAVIMVTGHGSVESAVEAMRLGAFDYLSKPFDIADLKRTVDQALGKKVSPPAAVVGSLSSPNTLKIVGQSNAIRKILGTIQHVADNDSPILLEGEFGVGKQLIARATHDASRRVHAPFKAIQCSALPEDHLEVELFGQGSAQPSIFTRLRGGTIHLAEIHCLPMRIQAQLNALLEQGGAASNGGPLAGTRLIASTSQHLEDGIRSGKFREDLYYKISVVPIHIPPLRERREDIPPLIEHFLREHALRSSSPMKRMERYASEFLEKYSWPGNISELRNAVERACALSEGDNITPTDLPSKVTQKVEAPVNPAAAETSGVQHLPIGSTLDDYIRGQEKVFINETLKFNNGSREKTASMLGISIATLYRKMELNVERRTTS
jgi:DNA-binding NtrC family response regulator